MSILTPDRRLCVFVSSTLQELADDTLDVLADLVDESLVGVIGEAAEPRFGAA